MDERRSRGSAGRRRQLPLNVTGLRSKEAPSNEQSFIILMSVSASSLRLWVFLAARRNPALLAILSYSAYGLLGAALLMLPALHEADFAKPVGFIDALFMSVSAISTTGLVTLDPASTFNLFGEVVLLLLIQIGGLGYMTFMSFAYLLLRERLSPTQARLSRSAFGLPEKFRVAPFVRQVIIATLVIELVGAVLLAIRFRQVGTEDAVWNGIFHSVSAFCTAGFALFPTSFEAYKADWILLLILSVLSYLGALGFVVLAECVEALAIRPRRLSLTTRIILAVSAWMLAGGTIFLLIFDPSIGALPLEDRFFNAVFQAMSASTTVGFNSIPIGGMSAAAILALYLLMFVGASPAGTGGGLKSTTAAALAAILIAGLRGRSQVRISGYLIPERRVVQASATVLAGLLVICAGVGILDLTGTYRLDMAVFEVISALATVGLSMGLTGELNDPGKLTITAIMLIGRVGMLSFFASVAFASSETPGHGNATRDIII